MDLDQLDLNFIRSANIHWFDPEEYPAYEKLHQGRHWLEIQIALRPDGPIAYEDAWDWFKKSAAPNIVAALGLESWFFGKGILDRRGQDILFIELDGFDAGEWLIIFSLENDHSLVDCCDRIKKIDEIIQAAMNKNSIDY